MNKCVSCGFDIPPQTRFCGNCGTVQPMGTSMEEAGSLETISAAPHVENTPASTPPPPPQKNDDANNRGAEFPPPGSGDNRPNINSTPVQASNQPSGPQPQPQTSYGDYQQPQAPYGNYQQPYNDYQQQPQQSQPQPQQPYSNYQQAPSPYGDYQQAQSPYGNYQQTPQAQPPYNGAQQTPYNGIQQTPPPQQPYVDYQQAPPLQSSYNYQQPQPSGIHTTATVANIDPVSTGTKPVTTETKKGAPAWRKWAIIGLIAVVVLAVSGLLFFVLRPPAPPVIPTISITSDYHDNGTPAAADGTIIHVKGQKFAANSAITILLDSTSVSTNAQSDPSGSFATDVPVTSSWSTGQHKITAHDASNNMTNTNAPISVVPQGFNGTPGPNGAPANSASFKIAINLHMATFADTYSLKVTGGSDAQGGTVCATAGDDGSQQKSSPQTLADGTVINEVSTYTCSGTYKGGAVTYNDTLNTRVYSDGAGNSCSLNTEQTSYIQITGTYTSSHQFSGDITVSSIAGSQYNCVGLTYSGSNGDSGTWTGTVSNS